MSYQSIDVRKLTPTIGAEIFGVDLGKPLGNQQFQEVHDALMENLVIFFRDQKMTIDQHKDFGRHFGPLHTHPNAPIEFKEHPEILVIKADEKSKHVAGEARRSTAKPASRSASSVEWEFVAGWSPCQSRTSWRTARSSRGRYAGG